MSFLSLGAIVKGKPIPTKGEIKMTVVAPAADALATITTATTGFLPDLMAVGGVAIGIGAGVLLLTRGWGLIKRFAK